MPSPAPEEETAKYNTAKESAFLRKWMYLIRGRLSVHVTVTAEQNLAPWMKILFALQFAVSKSSSISSDVSFDVEHYFTQQETCKNEKAENYFKCH